MVGGLAVKFYCPDRPAGDLDILVDVTNANKVGQVLTNLAQDGLVSHSEIHRRQELERHGTCVRLRTTLKADILAAKETYDFSSAYARSIEAKMNDISVCVVSIDDLLAYKEADKDPECPEKNERDIALLRSELQRCNPETL